MAKLYWIFAKLMNNLIIFQQVYDKEEPTTSDQQVGLECNIISYTGF